MDLRSMDISRTVTRMNKTNYKQYDTRWSKLGYPKAPWYIKDCGCGEVAICNCIIEMAKYKAETPKTIQPYCKQFAAPNGDGTYFSGIPAMMKHYGMTEVKEHATMTPLWEELAKGGRVAIYLMGNRRGGSKGVHWTSSAHFVCSTGYKYENGKHWLYVKDSNSASELRNGWISYEDNMRGDVSRVWSGKVATASKGTTKKVYKVIDVSDWQGKIDWKAVKADGIVGVIIRYADGTTLDKRFDENMRNAKAAGLHTGCYIFSRSKTKEGAEKEAIRLYNASKKYAPDMPLFIDLEANDLSRYADTIAIAFLAKMKALGAKGGVYANLYWWNHYLTKTATEHNNNAFWIAQYNDTMDYKPASRMGMWQYSSSGRVSGISGRVDMDKCYVAYWEQKNPPKKEEPKKTVSELAKEVIAGKWGDGAERVRRLKEAGYDPDAVQKKVNEILASKPTNREKLAKCANDFAYSTNTKSAAYPSGKPKAAYKTALYKVYPNLKNGKSAASKGASCDVFVGTCVRSAGIDKDFPRGLSPSYLAKSPKFKQIDKKNVAQGDIIVSPKHICIAWSDGKVKEASNGDFYPKTTSSLSKRLNASGVKVYRAK